MSIKIMTDVWDSAPFEGPTLLLLIALADSANDDGICWPSIPALCKKTRQPERTVYHGIRTIIGSGWLEKISNPGRGNSNFYRVLTPTVKGARYAPFDNPEKVQVLREKVQGMQSKGARYAVPIRKNRKGTVRNRNTKTPTYVEEREQMERILGSNIGSFQ